MTFGLYHPGTSLLHRLPAALKLGVLTLAGVGIFFLTSIPLLLVGLVGTVGLGAIARLPFPRLWAHIRPILGILLILVLAHALLTEWQTGVMLALRFLTLIGLATLVTLTTPTLALVEALTGILSPLRPLGVKPERVSVMVAIAIRFIPVLLDQIRAIQEAQRARGVERPVITLLVPLLVKTMHLADDLVDALDARCFDSLE